MLKKRFSVNSLIDELEACLKRPLFNKCTIDYLDRMLRRDSYLVFLLKGKRLTHVEEIANVEGERELLIS